MPIVDVHGTKIYFQIRGDGAALVMIMGLATGAQAWISQVSVFQQHFRCILFDNRGVGRSDKPDYFYTTRVMANDVVGLLDALAIPRAHVIGFSLGALIAQEFALAYPERVDKLILSNSFPKLDGSERQMLGVWKHMAEKGRIALFFEEFAARIFTPEYMEVHSREVATFKLAITANPPPAHSLIRQIEAIEQHDTRKRLGQVRALTLVLSSAKDLIAPVAYGEALAAGIPRATLRVLLHGGHAAFIEESELYNAAVLRFLNGLEP